MKNKLPAQILAITLLALLIIAIVIVGIFNLTSRDVSQTVANREYENLYNSGETLIFQLVDKYGNSTVPLSTLTTDAFPAAAGINFSQCNIGEPGVYDCDFTTDLGQVIETEVSESPDVVDFELDKDESLELIMNGYDGDIIFSWNGIAALEFTLVYRDGAEAKVTNGLFDLDGVFDSNGGDPLTNPFSNHLFPFIYIGNDEYRFNIRDIIGLPAGANPEFLRVTARRVQAGSIELSIRGEIGFPSQVRKFTARAYDPTSQSNVVATVESQVPLLPQSLSIFNYSLLVDGIVRKESPQF